MSEFHQSSAQYNLNTTKDDLLDTTNLKVVLNGSVVSYENHRNFTHIRCDSQLTISTVCHRGHFGSRVLGHYEFNHRKPWPTHRKHAHAHPPKGAKTIADEPS